MPSTLYPKYSTAKNCIADFGIQQYATVIFSKVAFFRSVRSVKGEVSAIGLLIRLRTSFWFMEISFIISSMTYRETGMWAETATNFGWRGGEGGGREAKLKRQHYLMVGEGLKSTAGSATGWGEVVRFGRFHCAHHAEFSYMIYLLAYHYIPVCTA